MKYFLSSSSLANNSSPNHSGAAMFSHSLSFPIPLMKMTFTIPGRLKFWHSGQDGKQARRLARWRSSGRMENWHASRQAKTP